MNDEYLKTNVGLQNAAKNLQLSTLATERMVYDSINKFYFDEEHGRMIEFEGKHSFTFALYRLEGDEKLSNIVFTEKENGDYETFVTKYDFTKEEYENMSAAEKAAQNASYHIFENGRIKMVQYCVEIQVYVQGACNETHSNGYECQSGWVTLSTECTWVTTGGSNGNSGDSGPTGPSGTDGGGGSNNGNHDPSDEPIINHGPVITLPVLEEYKPLDHVDHLNQITNRTEVKERLAELKEMVNNVQVEHGSEYFTDNSPTQPLIREDLAPEPTGIHFGPIQENSIFRVHLHHSDIEPIFSIEDIFGFANFFKTKQDLVSDDALDITSALVSKLSTVALRINNPEKAYKFGQAIQYSAFVKVLKQKYQEKVRIKAYKKCDCVGPNPELDILLLEYLNDFLDSEDTGFSLYQATVNTNGQLVWTLIP